MSLIKMFTRRTGNRLPAMPPKAGLGPKDIKIVKARNRYQIWCKTSNWSTLEWCAWNHYLVDKTFILPRSYIKPLKELAVQAAKAHVKMGLVPTTTGEDGGVYYNEVQMAEYRFHNDVKQSTISKIAALMEKAQAEVQAKKRADKRANVAD